MDIIKITAEIGRNAHQQYLDTWEIKTQVAENNGEWTTEIQRQVLENMEKISGSLSLLARSLSHYLDPNDPIVTVGG